MSRSILVVGAGVSGLLCAVACLRRGMSVRVRERASRLGEGACSWYAGAMLAPWCEAEYGPSCIRDLGMWGIGRWRELKVPVGEGGSVIVAPHRDRGRLVQLCRRTGGEWVEGGAFLALEPELGARYGQGVFFPHEGHVNPREVLEVLADQVRGAGGEICFESEGEGDALDFDAIVDCRGLGARACVPQLRGVRGEMLVVRCPEVELRRLVRLLHPRFPVYLVPRGEGVYMLGATVVESDVARVSGRSVMDLLLAAAAVHPAFGEAEILEMGAGVRPTFPDHLPRLICEGKRIFMNGFYRHGFLLAPAFAEYVAHHLSQGEKGYGNFCERNVVHCHDIELARFA